MEQAVPHVPQWQRFRTDRDARQGHEDQERHRGEEPKDTYRPVGWGRGGGLRALFWGLSTNTWLG